MSSAGFVTKSNPCRRLVFLRVLVVLFRSANYEDTKAPKELMLSFRTVITRISQEISRLDGIDWNAIRRYPVHRSSYRYCALLGRLPRPRWAGCPCSVRRWFSRVSIRRNWLGCEAGSRGV